MTKNNNQAQFFSVGDFIQEELATRNWTLGDLAAILNWSLQSVKEIIDGKKRINGQVAEKLAAAFGTSAELWLNLETSYRSR